MTLEATGKSSCWTFLGKRLLDWRNIASAVFSLALAAAYVRAAIQGQGLWGLDPERLARLMQIEFLVIHSFPFMGVIALLRPTAWRLRALQWGAFWGLLALYLWIASTEGGWESVLTFAGLTLATYMGFLIHRNPETQVLRLGFRWILSISLFIFFAVVTGMPTSVNIWDSSEEVHLFGLLYFLAHGLLEWTGFYQDRWVDKLARLSRKPAD